MNRPLRRCVRNHMNAEGSKQCAHQRAHSAVFNQVVKILQGKAGPQRRLIKPQLGTNPFKIPCGVCLHQFLCPANQKNHGTGRGLGINDADLLFRMFFQNHLPPHHRSVIRTGKVCRDRKADGLIPCFKCAGKGCGRRAGSGRGAFLICHSRQ